MPDQRPPVSGEPSPAAVWAGSPHRLPPPGGPRPGGPALHRLAVVPGGGLRPGLHHAPVAGRLALPRGGALRRRLPVREPDAWPRARPRPTSTGSWRTSSACPVAPSSSRWSAACCCRRSRVIAVVSAARATTAWDDLLLYLNAQPFGRTDPLFGRDSAFYVFQLPFWRLFYGWATTLVAAAMVLTAAVYVLQRGLVLTDAGAAARGGGADASPGAGGRHARTPRHRILAGPLRAPLLSPRAWCSAPRTPTSTRRCPRSDGSRRWPSWSRPPASSRSSGPAGGCWSRPWWCSGVFWVGRPGRLPGASAALPRHPERAQRRAALHPAQHPDDPPRLRSRRESPRRTSRPRRT